MMGAQDEAAVYGREAVAVLTAAESAALDRRARETAGVPERVLMENAGRSAALVLQHLYPRGRVLGFAGPGNNGGDLLVMLRTLRHWGRDCTLVTAGTRPPDASLLYGVELPTAPAHEAARYDVLVDGLLGTGAQGAPRGDLAVAIDALNQSGRPVLALDIPSGVDGTTGATPGVAVQAAVTATFGWPKLGLMLHPGRARAGRLLALEIGFPPLGESEATGALITPEWAKNRLPVRSPDAHKGTSGRLLLVAGRSGMAGAAAIAAEAAVRCGTGLVRVASAADNRAILQSLVPEATFFEREALAEAALEGITAAVIGPGFGTDAGSEAALEQALEATRGVPTLLDADALNLLARDPGALRELGRERPLVITPHPRELSRLLATDTEAIVQDAPGAAGRAQETFGCVVLLKGQPSLVASAGAPLLINTAGSSDVAVGGMGDQLAGVIGALLAAGVAPREAAGAGLYLSSRSADLATRGRALSPRDVSAHLVQALRLPGAAESSIPFPFITFDQSARR